MCLFFTLSLPQSYLYLWRAAELSKVSVIFRGKAHWSLGITTEEEIMRMLMILTGILLIDGVADHMASFPSSS